jgi:hypothetical protein
MKGEESKRMEKKGNVVRKQRTKERKQNNRSKQRVGKQGKEQSENRTWVS